MKDQKVKRVFTFGFGQLNVGKYYVIWGKDEDDCRSQMFEIFGDKWSMMYRTEEDAGVKKYGLTELKQYVS